MKIQKKMEEKIEIKAVEVKVTIRYEPNYIAKIICPNCKKRQWDYLDEKETGKTLLHSCQFCDEDFYIHTPKHFPPLK